MKKLICVLMAMMLCALAIAAAAESAIDNTVTGADSAQPAALTSVLVQHETLNVVDSYGIIMAYVYAEVTNNTKDIQCLDDSVVILKDKDGNPAGNITMLRMNPEALAPGETGIVSGFKNMESGEAAPATAVFNIVLQHSQFYTCEMVEVEEAKLGIGEGSFGYEDAYLTAKIVNNTNKDMTGLNVCFVVKDKETGLIKDFYEDPLYDSILIPANNSIVVRQNLLNNSIDVKKADQYEVYAFAYKVEMKGF